MSEEMKVVKFESTDGKKKRILYIPCLEAVLYPPDKKAGQPPRVVEMKIGEEGIEGYKKVEKSCIQGDITDIVQKIVKARKDLREAEATLVDMDDYTILAVYI